MDWTLTTSRRPKWSIPPQQLQVRQLSGSNPDIWSKHYFRYNTSGNNYYNPFLRSIQDHFVCKLFRLHRDKHGRRRHTWLLQYNLLIPNHNEKAESNRPRNLVRQQGTEDLLNCKWRAGSVMMMVSDNTYKIHQMYRNYLHCTHKIRQMQRWWGCSCFGLLKKRNMANTYYHWHKSCYDKWIPKKTSLSCGDHLEGRWSNSHTRIRGLRVFRRSWRFLLRYRLQESVPVEAEWVPMRCCCCWTQ